MEGGQKVSINLESPLETSTSDMLVPINQPTFQHNWQKYQGKFLPNSLRFEKNGWAAGWNVFDFKYNKFIKKVDDIYVGISCFNDYVHCFSVFENENDYESKANYFVIKDNYILSGNDISITDIDEYSSEIKGFINQVQFTLAYNEITHEITSSNERFKVKKFINSDYSFSVEVIDTCQSIEFNFNLSLCSDKLTSESFISNDLFIEFNSVSEEETDYDVLSRYTFNNYSIEYRENPNDSSYNGYYLVNPENVTCKASVNDNLLTFNYNK